MAQNKYEELVEKIPSLVGGVENISSFTHCATRLRFNLKNKSGVDAEAIKKLPGAKGVAWAGDQLQVIIGTEVDDVYEMICKKTGLAASSAVDENLDGNKKFSIKDIPMSILDVVAGSISPVIGVLIGTGMIKIILLLGSMWGILPSDSSTYQILSAVSDSAFYFLPVLVGSACANKFGMDGYMGAVLGAMLIHPDFVSLVDAGSITVFGLPVYSASYSSSIFPAILTVWVASYIYKFMKKHSPAALRSILVPFITILVMVPLSFCVLAPLGDIIGVYLCNGIIWLYETLGFLGVAIFAGLHPLLVMTGMQHGVGAYLVASLTGPGFEGLASPATVVDNINIGIATLAVAAKTKIASKKADCISCGITATIGGITEPALFGVVLQHKVVLISTMIGSAVGGAIAGIFGCVSYAFAGSYGVFGLVTWIGGDSMSNLYFMILAVIVGAIVTFVLTFMLYKDDSKEM